MTASASFKKPLYPAKFQYLTFKSDLFATITKSSEKIISLVTDSVGETVDIDALNIPFNAHILTHAGKSGDPVFITNSEEDAIHLCNLSFAAACAPTSQPWRPEWTQNFFDANSEVILIWHEADGIEKFEKTVEAFSGIDHLKFIMLPIGFANFRSYQRQKKIGPFSLVNSARKVEHLKVQVEKNKIFVPVAQLLQALEPIDYLIEGFAEKGTVISLLGKTSSFKSFLAVQWSVHVAQGLAWCGRLVKKSAVFYLALEGAAGIQRRVAAMAMDLKLDLKDPKTLSNFFISSCGFELNSAESMERTRAAIRKLVVQNQGNAPGLIVVDTFARAMGASADENSAKDIAAVLKNIKEYLQESFPQTVIALVSHTGHSDSTRQRGSSAIKAALDTECHISREGDLATLIVSKIKDGRRPEPLFFKLEEIDLTHLSTTGAALTSAVLRLKESLLDLKVGAFGVNRSQDLLLGEVLVLAKDSRINGQTLVAEFDLPIAEANRVLLKILELGFLEAVDGRSMQLSDLGKKQVELG